MAYSLLTSPRLREALDIRREPRAVRESYGMTLFGQAALIARRLIEAGGRFVSVFWDEYGLADSAWDTHYQHYPRMKNELCPAFDRGLLRTDPRPGGAGPARGDGGPVPQRARPDPAAGQRQGRRPGSLVAGLLRHLRRRWLRGRARRRQDRPNRRGRGGDADVAEGRAGDDLPPAGDRPGIDAVRDRLGRPLPIAGEGKVRPELLA